MSAPVGFHDRALDQLGRALAAVLASAVERRARSTDCAAITESAGDCRPLGAGDQLQTHEDRTTRPRNLDAAFEEDDRREQVASTDN